MALGRDAIGRAAAALAQAWRTGDKLDALPADAQPADLADALAIQEAMIAATGEPVAGWKTNVGADGGVVRGAILGSRLFASPARVKAALVPMLAMECEIAFRFDRDLPPRPQPYSRDEVAAAVTALAAIEIVDSRFRDFRGTPPIHRTADCASNGGFVQGTLQPDWRRLDIAKLDASVAVDGTVVVSRSASHPAGDPLAPAVALVNDARARGGIKAGQIMTTGSLTGVTYVKPGNRVVGTVGGVGSAEIVIEP